jgi:hypothetical protein
MRYPQIGDLGWRFNLPDLEYGSLVYDQYGSLAGYGDFIITMPDGGKHNINAMGYVMDSEDGATLRLNNSNPGSGSADLRLVEKDGTSIHFRGTNAGSDFITDANGNSISSGNNTLIDTLGRQISFAYSSSSHRLTSISYKDSNGNTQTVTLNYTQLTLFQTTAGQYYTPTPPFTYPKQVCATGGNCGRHVWVIQPVQNTTYYMLTSIVLPDLTSYTFTYNGWLHRLRLRAFHPYGDLLGQRCVSLHLCRFSRGDDSPILPRSFGGVRYGGHA